MKRVLLTYTGVMDPQRPAQMQRGERPRADYLEMAHAFDADVLDYAGARRLAGLAGRLLERLGGPKLLLAWGCFLLRGRYRVIFTDGEQIGIPLAWLLKYLGGKDRPRHLMIAHILSVGKKMLFLDAFRLQSHIDTFFVYSSWQARFIAERWHVPAARLVLTPFMVDSHFFAPRAASPSHEREGSAMSDEIQICAVGLEYRDYPTLLAAVRGLPVRVVIAAASPWSRHPDTTAGQELPENVDIRRLDQNALRQLYADSRFLVMPLFDVPFQAGVTAILEAMSMQRAVICSRTSGQTDVVVEGETGLYVPAGDAQALRAAIEWLISRPHEATRMGQEGRRLVERTMNLDCYVERLASYVRAAAESAPNGHRQGETA